MATITRSNSRTMPTTYRDYVNFLGGYKSGKKDEDSSDSGISVNNFSLSNSSSTSSSISSDVTDFKTTCIPYNTYVENSKTKKFTPVKPTQSKKTEIFIEIQPTKSVSEVSKVFENGNNKQETTKINSKIKIFEKQISTEKPKIALKPKITGRTSPDLPPPPPEFLTAQNEEFPPPPPEFTTLPQNNTEILSSLPHNTVMLPPPPPLPQSTVSSLPPQKMSPPKLQASLTIGPQTKFAVNNPKGVIPGEIDRNDPMVRKLVYGTLRGLYGAYHDKASDMLATMPKNMVVRSNGVQDRIEQIAYVF